MTTPETDCFDDDFTLNHSHRFRPTTPPKEEEKEEDSELINLLRKQQRRSKNIVDLEQHTNRTSFKDMFDFFLSGITDDMFMELTKEDTMEILEEILLAALPHFEFPRQSMDLDLVNKTFKVQLTTEEMMIIRQYMISEWIGMQLASVDVIRQKYSGSDFKFTSQASHIKQLVVMKEEYEQKGFHLQRVYCRRKKDASTGGMVSTMGSIMGRQR